MQVNGRVCFGLFIFVLVRPDQFIDTCSHFFIIAHCSFSHHSRQPMQPVLSPPGFPLDFSQHMASRYCALLEHPFM